MKQRRQLTMQLLVQVTTYNYHREIAESRMPFSLNVESQFMFILFTFTLVLAIVMKQRRASSRGGPRRHLPPGPPRLPIIGNLHLIGALPHRSLHSLATTYGPLMHLQLGQIRTLVVSSPAHARDVLKTHDLTFCTRPHLFAWHKLSYGGLDLASARYSPQQIRSRKITVAEFLSTKCVERLQTQREEEVRTLVRNLARAAQSRGPSGVNLSEMLRCLTSNITCRAVFGNRYAAEGECSRTAFEEVLKRTVKLMAGFVAGDYFPHAEYWLNLVTGVQRRLEKSFKEMDELLERELEKREGGGNGDGNDFASVLLRLQRDASNGLSREDVKAILMDMFFGGIDTSAATLVWVMTELMRNPRALNKAQEEVRLVVRGEDYVREGDVQQLSYLDMVFKEAFRLHPPGPLLLPRESRAECTIAGYDIPIGTRVYVNVWAIGRRAETWESPDEFRPERFSESAVDYKGQHFELIPFGGGRRMCPALVMGETLVKATVATLLHEFDWSLPAGMGEDEIDVSEAFGIVVWKKVPLVLVPTPAKLD